MPPRVLRTVSTQELSGGAVLSPSAPAVAASTVPVAARPLRDWNAVTADWVAGP